MPRVPIQVQQGATLFHASVQAQSIRKPWASWRPGIQAPMCGDIPDRSEAFFAEEPSTRVYPTRHEQRDEVAA